jgi:2-polyprenyl-3-methyl-5-hydroxy-6-metoxy-1,4-benzoquinol methylase
MKAFDYWLQKKRIAQAAAFINTGAHVLDIGSYDGALFKQLYDKNITGAGVDPLAKTAGYGHYRLVKGLFPQAFQPDELFDCITMLAVLEHIPVGEQPKLAQACHQHLKPKGRVIITVPAPQVDYILAVLRFLRIIDGMSLEEHYGFKTTDTPHIFSSPLFKLLSHKTFQFGLNHVFVFEKVS